ncbi:MCP four helix bundle domain-containing protein [Alicyclobacillus sacchari]|uniref:MCP four helix bundle domain-containing protein n=1 Tax=Alicyclobacillus sacchari TaxID=392010 RepID=UPI0024E13266|nr:methyl-accepting chemotaxis protein [Alicyclobacillus sacchari]
MNKQTGVRIVQSWNSIRAQITRLTPRLRIRQKFMVNTALMTVLIVAIGVANGVIVQKIHASIANMESAEQVLNMIRQFDYDIRSADSDAAIYLLAPNGPEAQYQLQAYNADASQVQADLKALQKMHISSQDQAILNLFESEWQPILSQNKTAFQEANTDLAQAQTYFTTNTIQPLIQSLMQFTDDEQSLRDAARSQVDALLKQTVLWNVLIAVVAIAIGFGGGWILSVVITKPILRMRKLAFELSKGNLKVEELKMTSRDELADLANVLNTLAANLRTLILGIAEASEHVAASSEELSASSDEMMHATEEIAQSIEQVAAARRNRWTKSIRLRVRCRP